MTISTLFSAFANLYKLVSGVFKHLIAWALNHIWSLIFPVVAFFKSVYDLIRLLMDKVTAAMQSISAINVFQYDGSASSVKDVLAFFNAILPLDELMLAGAGLFLFWQACLIVRFVRGLRALIAG